MSGAFDVCVVGSGAGAGATAWRLTQAGYSVAMIEKGPWYTREDFPKDEIVATRRHMFVPPRAEDPHVWDKEIDGEEKAWITETGWNANCVGGASNVMSGFFLRLKPIDFRQRSELGPVEGGNVADWPIGYEDLAPYYDLVERVIGVSGEATQHPWADVRTQPFPYPPTDEHAFAARVDTACEGLGLHAFPLPRAILPYDEGDRRQCNYSGYCGGYGCTTGAKGSSRSALLPAARATGRLDLRFGCRVTRVLSDATGRATGVEYVDADGRAHRVEARIVVVACSAIESARLLLLSVGPKHPRGIANGNGLVGRNLLFSTFGTGWGDFPYRKDGRERTWLRDDEPWVNRAVQDHYVIEDGTTGRRKGGTISFLRMHPNPITAAFGEATFGDRLLWGAPLKRRLERHFRDHAHLRFEVFGDYTPVPGGEVVLDPFTKDHWGLPAARVRVRRHDQDLASAEFLTETGREVLRAMGAEDVRSPTIGSESSNLIGGTCRFGADPATSVLDADCRAHEVENLFVTDGSFMPSGGSVPFTFTIYANALRVADRIVEQLGRAP